MIFNLALDRRRPSRLFAFFSSIVYGLWKQDPLDVVEDISVIDSFYYKFLIFYFPHLLDGADSSFMIRARTAPLEEEYPTSYLRRLQSQWLFLLCINIRIHFPRRRISHNLCRESLGDVLLLLIHL